MSLEQCTSLQGTVEDSSPISFSAIDQLSLLSGIDTPARYSENEQQTDGSQACTCGKATSDCLIHPSTPEAWIAFMRDSLVRTLALLESRQEYLMEPDQVFTEKSCASLAWFDQSSCSWKTYQQSLVTDWEPYSETWPRWGMTVGGSAFAHPMSERRITEIDGLLFATPNTMDSLPPKSEKALHREMTVTRLGRSQPANLRDQVTQMRNWFPTPTVKTGAQVAWDKTPGQTGGTSLPGYVKFFPTPTTRDYKGGYKTESLTRKDGKSRHMDALPNAVLDGMGAETATGQLNPDWVEWLMGFTIGFTASRDWVTPKSHSKPQQPTDCSEDNKCSP